MKKILSIVLAVAMMLTMVVPAFAETFTDIKDSDYKIAIEKLTELGIVNGRTATTYEPDGIVTRAEMAKLLVVCLKLESGADILKNTTSFDDVPTTHWAIGYINVAAQYDLIRGDGDGNFRPDDTVNYAEAVTMCIRALNYARVVDKTGEWPTNYLNKALELGIFDDVEFANAKDGANRGSIAQIIWNMVISPMWVVTEENEEQDKNVGVVETISNKLGKYKITIEGKTYDIDENPADLVGSVVKFKQKNEKIKIIYVLNISEIIDVNNQATNKVDIVKKVDDELVYLGNNNIDMDKVRKNLKDDKYNVLKISLDCNEGNYSFDTAKEIEIDDISISKEDIICADTVNKYFIIINGYEDLN